MDDKLHKAITSGRLEEVKDLITNGASINNLFGMKGTPLCAAIFAKQPPVVDYLIESGCDVNAKDYDGEPPLCLALRRELYDLAEKVISTSGCDVNKIDPISRQYPIHIAVKNGWLDFVKLLVSRKCKLNGRDADGNTPLHLAILSGQKAIAKYLIEAGCDMFLFDRHGNLPVHSTVVKNDVDTLNALLQNVDLSGDKSSEIRGIIDARTTGSEDTSLILAVKEDNFEVFCELIKHGCDLDLVNITGETALYLACKYIHTDIAVCLLESGALVNVALNEIYNSYSHEKHLKVSPIHEAISIGNFLLVKKLLEHGADLNAYYQGQSALYCALSKNKSQIADYLLEVCEERKLNVTNVTTNTHYNLLFAAASCSDPAFFARRLLDLGCPVNHVASGPGSISTPLLYAVEMECTPLAEVLLEHGANTEFYDPRCTALHLCACNGLVSFSATLIQWGANINVATVNSAEETPIHLAISNGNVDVCRVLLMAGCTVREEMIPQYEGDLETFTSDDEQEELLDTLWYRARNVQKLTSLCRAFFVRYFKGNGIDLKRYAELPLPKDLKEFLRFKELDKMKYLDY